MNIPDILHTAAKLENDLKGEKLDLAIMQAGVIWDEERELVKKIYEILEDYRNGVEYEMD